MLGQYADNSFDEILAMCKKDKLAILALSGNEKLVRIARLVNEKKEKEAATFFALSAYGEVAMIGMILLGLKHLGSLVDKKKSNELTKLFSEEYIKFLEKEEYVTDVPVAYLKKYKNTVYAVFSDTVKHLNESIKKGRIKITFKDEEELKKIGLMHSDLEAMAKDIGEELGVLPKTLKVSADEKIQGEGI